MKVEAKLIEAGGESDIEEAIENIDGTGDSIGGVVECRVSGTEPGMGNPFFGSAESVISHMIFSIPATRGIEFGSGFETVKMKGSEHNDVIVSVGGKTATNNAGGINGGITNGNDIIFKVAVKPTSSISVKQHTINMTTGKMVDLEIEGRHDACIAVRIPVVIENATAIVMADLMMQRSAEIKYHEYLK